MGKDEIKNQGRFYKLPVEIACRQDLPGGVKVLFAVMADRVGQNDSCWPGLRTLANDTGSTKTTILAGIKTLEIVGLLETERRGNGRVNHYRIIDKSGQETIPVKKLYRSRNLTTGGQKTIPEAVKKLDHNQTDPLNQTHISCRNSDAVRLSRLLLNQILSRKPDFKKPNLQIWVKDLDLLLRDDHRRPEKVEQVILWSQSDPFWQSNILSVRKLRQQFDCLELKMIQSRKEISGVRNPETRRNLAAAPASRFGETIET